MLHSLVRILLIFSKEAEGSFCRILPFASVHSASHQPGGWMVGGFSLNHEVGRRRRPKFFEFFVFYTSEGSEESTMSGII